MGWTRKDRARAVDSLDRARQQVTTFYRLLLLFVAAAFLGYIGFAVWKTESWGSQGEAAFLAIFVLLVIGWIANEFLSTRRSSGGGPGLPPVRGGSEELEGGGRIFRFSIGTPPETREGGAVPGRRTFTFSRSFSGEMPLPSLFDAHTPDEAALATAEEHRSAGRDWDDVCARLNPGYGGWDQVRQALYRTYVEALLDARRQGRSDAP